MDDAELLIAATLLNLKSNQHQNAVDNLHNLHESTKDEWVAQHGAPPNFNDDPWKK